MERELRHALLLANETRATRSISFGDRIDKLPAQLNPPAANRRVTSADLRNMQADQRGRVADKLKTLMLKAPR